jgi:hypothetical protein
MRKIVQDACVYKRGDPSLPIVIDTNNLLKLEILTPLE